MTALTSVPFSPLNDLVVLVTLKTVDHTTGVVSPLNTGTVTAFIANGNTASAVAIDPLSVTATKAAGVGQWLVAFDAAVMTQALLDTNFGAGQTPYLIVQQTNALRRYIPLSYTPGMAATIAG